MTIRPTTSRGRGTSPTDSQSGRVHTQGMPESRFDLPTTPQTPEWMLSARCRDLSWQVADALFFPGPGAQGNTGLRRRQMCGNCPVKQDCLEYGLANATEGYWGGVKIAPLVAKDERFIRGSDEKATA